MAESNASSTQRVRIVCISDTHNHAPGEGYTLPKGDILVHAGDLTNQGSYVEFKKAVAWLEKADFAVKIVVAGNHDLALDTDYGLKYAEGWRVQPEREEAAKSRKLVMENEAFTYLQHSATIVEIPSKNARLRVFGSPYSPDRGKQNWAFQYPDHRASSLWDAIPADTDLLITHTPPAGHCDASAHWPEGGCRALAMALERVRPLVHSAGTATKAAARRSCDGPRTRAPRRRAGSGTIRGARGVAGSSRYWT
ncbi:hypothetical protein LTR53_004018 [Teratosphaeriaceae sp. CCFEE 6253]|nr:hypothetical protein LTR53_004018 [Teratosphaeriaceae sp. CCFEE 6253]